MQLSPVEEADKPERKSENQVLGGMIKTSSPPDGDVEKAYRRTSI
jgi:hypothetical protein